MDGKKWVAGAALMALLGAAGTAEARIDSSRMALGGITVGSTEEYVRETYGPPASAARSFSPEQNQYVKEYSYGDSFFVTVLEDTGTVLWLMSRERHNNIATPDGIMVGSTLNEVLHVYGEPDLRQIDGDSDYLWYFADDGEEGRLVVQVSFGRVVGITCGGR